MMYKAMQKPAAVCGSETWAVAEVDMNRLGAWNRKILRRLHGSVVEHGIWRIKTDQELRELYKDLDIVAGIREKRLEWIGHVVGIDQGRRVKKIFESKPDRSIGMGRTRLTWLEDVQKGLREMKVQRWREKAFDREEWASIIKEAKALRRP